MKTGRHVHRDSNLILVTCRHGFRVSKLTALRWDQVELDSESLHGSRIWHWRNRYCEVAFSNIEGTNHVQREGQRVTK